MISITGNSNIKSKEYNVSSFVHLHISVNSRHEQQQSRVELHQSTDERVVIETDENLLEYFSVVNSGKTLFITTEPGYRSLDFSGITVKIYFRQLRKLNLNCERCQVICANPISLSTSIDIKIQGAMNIGLKLDVHHYGNAILSNVNQQGAGEIKHIN